jgi:hypothetical protein
MNELIQEFAEQADLFADSKLQMKGEYHPDWHGIRDKKFAELIILECVGVVEKLGSGYKDYRNQIEDAFRRDCVEEMKQHFGIE